MDVSARDILFSKAQSSLFDATFSRLSQVISNERVVPYNVLLSLLDLFNFDHAQVDEVSKLIRFVTLKCLLFQLFHYMSFYLQEFVKPFCRKHFYIFLRLTSILEAKEKICKQRIIHFESSIDFNQRLHNFVATTQ